MDGVLQERWPPAYDAEDLRQNIRDLVESGKLAEQFYEPKGRPAAVAFAQGDVLEMPARFPYLNDQAQPQADNDDTRFWVIVGNTCDLDRDLEQVKWTNVVPIRELARDGVPKNVLDELRRYKHGRRFYVPPWGSEVANLCLIAEFTEIVTIHRTGLQKAEVKARMDRPGWLLFHSCVVRYLARDDGRHHPG